MSFERIEIKECTLYRGDCLEVLSSLQCEKMDCTITSPPYNCGKDYGDYDDQKELTEYWAWTEAVVSAVCRVLADHGRLCVNHGTYIGSRKSRVLVAEELEPILSRHLPRIDMVIWDKGPARGMAWGNFRTSARIRAQHENIWIHGGIANMPPSDIDWQEWSRFTTSIWRVPTTDVDSNIHPAMMPTEIARRLCLLYSPARGLVLDPFMGSGTTGIACIRTGRRFVGIENDSKHFDTACKRIEAEYERGTLLDNVEAISTQQQMFGAGDSP